MKGIGELGITEPITNNGPNNKQIQQVHETEPQKYIDLYYFGVPPIPKRLGTQLGLRVLNASVCNRPCLSPISIRAWEPCVGTIFKFHLHMGHSTLQLLYHLCCL